MQENDPDTVVPNNWIKVELVIDTDITSTIKKCQVIEIMIMQQV